MKLRIFKKVIFCSIFFFVEDGVFANDIGKERNNIDKQIDENVKKIDDSFEVRTINVNFINKEDNGGKGFINIMSKESSSVLFYVNEDGTFDSDVFCSLSGKLSLGEVRDMVKRAYKNIDKGYPVNKKFLSTMIACEKFEKKGNVESESGASTYVFLNLDILTYKFFNGCSNIEVISVADGDGVFKIDPYCLFAGCENLKIVSLKNVSGIRDNCSGFYRMFSGCKNLRYINLENLEIKDSFFNFNLYMFDGCENLVAIFVSDRCDKLIFSKAPEDVYFCCKKGLKDTVVKNAGEKYKNRIIEVDSQSEVLDFFINEKEVLKFKLKKMFEDVFVKK